MASLFRSRPNVLCQCHRSFSTSAPRAISLQLEKNDAEAVAETVPAYPHGPTRWYKQSRLGLYGGQRIRFGNNVGEKFENKTRRSWHLNVLTRKLFSRALNRHVQLRVTTRTLRTIDKLGGLDEYLLGEKEARIKQLGESGWWLRWAIMQTPSIRKRFAEERIALGVTGEQVNEEAREVAEAQTGIEEATEAEAEALAETGEVVEMDNTFQIEQSPDRPPLKFRVGPGKHIYLTADGWRRTRPSPTRLEDMAIARRHKILLEHVIPERERDFKKAMVLQQQTLPVEQRLSAEERVKMLRQVKRMWSQDLESRARLEFEESVTVREQRKAERKEVKRIERQRERKEKGAEMRVEIA
ncbi:hypothetical protein LTR62_006200 [Meristemomyces frigidus]|uniref:Large ribosomal subunit protein bL28m n=1 Tax=Meristemomyces frigidus TaxID=1508187 RepID=A0AAN7TCE0_9PEZI|nr:hypothetical protein LTR62_006200 [Meristemomyces frigidus]